MNNLIVIGNSNSILNHYLSEIRDINVQSDRLRFRRNIERIGEIMAYEISKELDYIEVETTTPLGKSTTNLMSEQPVLSTVLRAGLPLHNGFLSYFDQADNAFLSAYRKHTTGDEFVIELEYSASPDLTDRTLILVDPMLATGRSMMVAYEAILKHGTPKQVIFAAVISSQQGVDYVLSNMPKNALLYTAALDPELNSKAYIVPGLGDAGDLAFGEKQ